MEGVQRRGEGGGAWEFKSWGHCHYLSGFQPTQLSWNGQNASCLFIGACRRLWDRIWFVSQCLMAVNNQTDIFTRSCFIVILRFVFRRSLAWSNTTSAAYALQSSLFLCASHGKLSPAQLLLVVGITSHHVTLYRITLYHITLPSLKLHHVKSHHITSHHIHHITLSPTSSPNRRTGMTWHDMTWPDVTIYNIISHQTNSSH